MSPRLIFIGLDGLGLDLAQSLAARGVMPHLGQLMARGGAWPTDSPLPEVSPVCWTSMFSGLEPGGHGVYGFGVPEPGAYRVRPVNSGDVRAPRIWDELSALGRASVVLNVPLTYPASAIEGVMVSGFVAPELTRAVHPPRLLPRLAALGYRPEADLEAGVTDPAALVDDLASAIAARAELFSQFWDDPWDLYLGVFTDSDRVNHFLWPALWDDGHPLAAPALNLYRAMDDFLGRLWRRFQAQISSGEIALLIAADHAFGPIHSEVYLNPWLRQQGFLQVEGWQDGPGRMRILPGSLALALDPGRVHLHWRGRFPGGGLRPGPAAEDALRRIRQGLLDLRFGRVETQGGRPVIRQEAPIARVHLGRELYDGPQSHLAPDLIAEAAPGYSLRAGLGRESVFGLSHLTGTHRPRGALACCLPAPTGAPPRRVSGLHGLMRGLLGLAPNARRHTLVDQAREMA